MRALTLMVSLALTACDDPNVHNAVQTALYSYLPDGSDPAVQDRAASVLTDGVVEAQIECTGVALGSAGKFVSVHYNAAKLQDGSCFASSNLTGPAPAGGGFAQSGASRITRRSDALAESCPVTSFHVPQLRSTTTVAGGVVRVESPFCAPGACTMLVATNCSGLRVDRF